MKKIIIGVISSLVASMMIAPNIFAWQSVDEYLQTPGIVTNIAKEINSYPALSNKVNAIIDKVNNSVANKNSLDKAIIYEALSRKIQMFVAERGYDSDMLIYRVLAYLSWDFDSRAEQIRKELSGNDLDKLYEALNQLFQDEYGDNAPILTIECSEYGDYESTPITKGEAYTLESGYSLRVYCQANANNYGNDLKNIEIYYELDGKVYNTSQNSSEYVSYNGASGYADISFEVPVDRKVSVYAKFVSKNGSTLKEKFYFSTDTISASNKLPEITGFRCYLDNYMTKSDIYNGKTYYMDDYYPYSTMPEGILINCEGKGYDADGDKFTMTISDKYDFVGETYTGEGFMGSSFLVKKETGPFGTYKKTMSIYDDKGNFVKSDSIGFYLYEGGKLYLEQENLGNQIIGLGSRDVEVLSMYVDGSNNGEYFLDDMLLYIGGEGDLRDIKTIDLYVNDVLYERSYPAAIVGNPDTLGMVSFRSLDASINPNTKIQIKVNFNESGKGNYYYFSTKGEYITIENQDYDEIDLSGEVRSGKYTLDIPVYLID